MKRFFALTILAGLFFFACNKENDKDETVANTAPESAAPESVAVPRYEALHDTLDSLNTLLFQKIRAGDVALRETAAAQSKKTTVEARTALWPLYAN